MLKISKLNWTPLGDGWSVQREGYVRSVECKRLMDADGVAAAATMIGTSSYSKK